MIPRFFVDSTEIRRDKQGFYAELSGEEAHHALRVLRMSPGDEVVLLDDSGLEFRGSVQAIESGGKSPRIVIQGASVQPSAGEPSIRLTLVQSLPKGDKMEQIVQKGTETGVTHFVPVLSERVVVEYTGQKGEKRLARWQRIAHEAAKQARRGRRPRVAAISSLIDAVRTCALEGPTLVLWEGSSLPIKGALQEIACRGDEVQALTLVVGPEGGFSESEAREMKALGGKLVSLGPRILRTETAGPVAAALALYELEMKSEGNARY